ncbi:hypothetical protein HYT84_04040 [Candidatus Micrarchaeota archaeon]|nr:hypothetical protein [Candidatus Micrarchaeota archaeon]
MIHSKSKGFIFSLDAFVAFTLALLAIYTLIFFSSISYGHYSGLMQAHYLAKDSLAALSLSEMPGNEGISKLDYIVLNENYAAIETYLDPLIPYQFGYYLETYDSLNDNWVEQYHSKVSPNPARNKNEKYRKLKTSSYALVFNYKNPKNALQESPNQFGYLTCKGEVTQCNPPIPIYDKDDSGMTLIRLTVYI